MNTLKSLGKRSALAWLLVALCAALIPAGTLHAQDERARDRDTRERRDLERKSSKNERLNRDGDKLQRDEEKLSRNGDKLSENNERLARDGELKGKETEKLSRNEDRLANDEKAKSAEELRQEQADRLRENYEAGKAWEAKTRQYVTEREKNSPSREVTFESEKGVKSRADLVYRDRDGKYVIVECKASETADFTRNQKDVFGSVRAGDEVTIRGNGMGPQADGQRVRISEIYVARPDANGEVRMEPYRERGNLDRQ